MEAEDSRMSTLSLYLISDAVSDSIGIFIASGKKQEWRNIH